MFRELQNSYNIMDLDMVSIIYVICYCIVYLELCNMALFSNSPCEGAVGASLCGSSLSLGVAAVA